MTIDHPHNMAHSPVLDTSSTPIFTHKMIKRVGEGSLPSLAYECRDCTFEQWESIDPPEGWSKGPAQVALFSTQDSTMRSYPSFEGQPDAVDFIDEIPGNEYRLIAVNLSGRPVGRGPNGLMVEAQVERDTRLVFTAGIRVHELTDSEGNIYVLFVHHVDTDDGQNIDFQSEDALAYFTPPEGWTYSTRIVERALVLDAQKSDGVVTILAIRGPINSAWEKYVSDEL